MAVEIDALKLNLAESESEQKLVESESENTRIRGVLSQQDKELMQIGQQQSLLQYKVTEAEAARAVTNKKISKLASELEALRAENGRLQKDNSIIREDQNQLEERQAAILRQLREAQAESDILRSKAGEADSSWVVAKERKKFYREKLRKTELQLQESDNIAQNYLRQLSYAS